MRKSAFAALAVIAIVVVLVVVAVRPRAPAEGAEKVRAPVVAGGVGGGFYPAAPDQLRSEVQHFLAAAAPPKLKGEPIAYMVPHAGYEFSGGVAAYAFKTLEGRHFDTVAVIGLSHHFPVEGLGLSSADAWQTPLGKLPVDRGLRDALFKQGTPFAIEDLGHAQEHSVEVELPFLQMTLKDFRLLPAVMSDESPETCRAVGEGLARALKGKSVLLIASSDMSHYPAHDAASRVDHATLDAITKFDPKALFAANRAEMAEGTPGLVCTLCGLAPVSAVMTAARSLGADTAQVLHYANSGDVEPAMRDRCVGYGAVAFVRSSAAKAAEAEPPAGTEAAKPAEGVAAYTPAEQKQMLATARRSIEEYLKSDRRIEVDKSDPALAKDSGVFVTLKKNGELRGCIGSILPRQPLIEAVRDMAIAAATEDWRFSRVQPSELGDIRIEISVLSYPARVKSPDEIVVGTHGVIVKQNGRSGVFLPQVAPEQGWTREEMLDELCVEKAGLPADAWKHGAELYTFTAFVFGEDEQAKHESKP